MGEDQPVFLVMGALFKKPDNDAQGQQRGWMNQMNFVRKRLVFSVISGASREQGHQQKPAGDHRQPVDGFRDLHAFRQPCVGHKEREDGERRQKFPDIGLHEGSCRSSVMGAPGMDAPGMDARQDGPMSGSPRHCGFLGRKVQPLKSDAAIFGPSLSDLQSRRGQLSNSKRDAASGNG